MKTFLGKRILVIVAHPDDESYVMAGSLYKNQIEKGETYLLCASYGEKGTSHLKSHVSKKELKQIRKKELLKAAKLLGVKEVKILDFPDAQLKEHKLKIFLQVFAYTKRIQPEVIVSFGPDGITAHYDHITIGEVAKRISKKLHVPFFAAAFPNHVAKNAKQFLQSKRKFGHYKHNIKYEKPNLRIPIDPKIKKRAIRAHVSQMDGKNAFTGFPQFAVDELLKAEYFVTDK